MSDEILEEAGAQIGRTIADSATSAAFPNYTLTLRLLRLLINKDVISKDEVRGLVRDDFVRHDDSELMRSTYETVQGQVNKLVDEIPE